MNLEEERLVAQRLMHEAVQNVGGGDEIDITKSLIVLDVRISHSRYVELWKAKKTGRSDQDEEALKKNATARAIEAIEAKKTKLLMDTQKEAALMDEEMRELLK